MELETDCTNVELMEYAIFEQTKTILQSEGEGAVDSIWRLIFQIIPCYNQE